MARKFFESSWGGVRVWLSRITTREGRSLVVQPFTRGDVPDVRDRGDEGVVCTCSLLFDDLTGAVDDPQDRLLALLAVKKKGEAQLLVHPIHGRFLAMIGDFEHTIEDDGTITAEASFTATEALGAVGADAIGVSLDVTADALEARNRELLAALEDSDLVSTVPAAATRAGATFDEASSARDVLVGIADVSERIAQEIDVMDLGGDIALWPALRAFVLLGDAVRVSGDLAMGDSTPLMTLRIDGPTSLRRLVSDIYGAREADARYAEARSLNDIPTPARIPTGTHLRLQQPMRAR